MLLYPFSARRYALDWLFIVDLVTWALPITALLVARVRPELARRAVVGFLLAMLAYGAAAGVAHESAVGRVVAAEREAGRAISEAFAFPLPGAPLRWTGVAIAPPPAPEPRVSMYRLHGVTGGATPTARLPRGFDDPWVAAALATRDGQAYVWWARVPVASTAREGGEVTVTLRDLRFGRTRIPTSETWAPFALRFHFDARTGRLVDASW
jgi:hypothetical protein